MNALEKLIAKHNAPVDERPVAHIVEQDLGDDDRRILEQWVYVDNKMMFAARDIGEAIEWMEANGYRRAE